MIYSIEKDFLTRIKERKVLEKEVQKLIGDNLTMLLQLVFIEFEFSVEKKELIFWHLMKKKTLLLSLN